MATLIPALRVLLDVTRSLRHLFQTRPPARADDPAVAGLVERADQARATGRAGEARELYEQALQTPTVDGTQLALVHCELGRLDAVQGHAVGAMGHFRSAVRADRSFIPAALALGDAQEAAGDLREAA